MRPKVSRILMLISKRVLVTSAGIIVFVSILWTAICAAAYFRSSWVDRTSVSPLNITNENTDIGLPRFDPSKNMNISVCNIISEISMKSPQLLDNRTLLSIHVIFDMVDSTYLYRFVSLDECGCPARVKDRFDLIISPINPTDYSILNENVYRNLTAEGVNESVQTFKPKGVIQSDLET